MEAKVGELGLRSGAIEHKFQQVEEIKDDVCLLRNEVKQHSVSIASVSNKLEDLENRNRRLNLVFYGHDDPEPRESWDVSQKIVADFCANQLGISVGVIQRYHRLGKHSERKSRPIITQFLHYRDVKSILGKCRELKGTNFSVSRDYSE